MMEKSKTNIKNLLFCTFVLLLFTLGTVHGDLGETAEEKPSLCERFIKISIELSKSSQGSWGKLKSLVYQIQQNFFPPTLDFRSRNEFVDEEEEVSGKTATTKRMADAVGKSFESSESALLGSAESMSIIVGEAVQITKEKVKETILEKKDEEDDHRRHDL